MDFETDFEGLKTNSGVAVICTGDNYDAVIDSEYLCLKSGRAVQLKSFLWQQK